MTGNPKGKRMTLYILIAVAAVVVVLVAIVASRPADFRVSRTATLPAPAATVFAHVNDLHKWEAWSPWARLDPNARGTYEGPPAGVGAMFRWDGNKNVGEGSMSITETRPNEFVQFRLEFLKPFKATNTAEFTFEAQGDQTVVTWSMFGKNTFVAKAVGLFIDCDKMVGGQFEQGLANLQSVLEAAHHEADK
jgi:uncharacterized protein YndB with AHSA1/START domain